MAAPRVADFDCQALYRALDEQRVARALSWRKVADEIWGLSAELNDRRHDHPISPSTITGMARRDAVSCQHALFFLRWLGRSPESFLEPPAVGAVERPLPDAGPDRRLRWHLGRLYGAMNERRLEEGLTWAELARALRCTPSQLTGLRTARFATGIQVAMRVVQWLERPAADFVYPARW
ncbi:MAG: hypothetical protein ACRDZR_05530 [Acidimicrobiales bacterium]